MVAEQITMPLNKDRDIVEIINAINRDLKHDQSFCELLTKLNDETARKIAKALGRYLSNFRFDRDKRSRL